MTGHRLLATGMVAMLIAWTGCHGSWPPLPVRGIPVLNPGEVPEPTIHTLAMHDPICPPPGKRVAFALLATARKPFRGIREVKLFVKVSTIEPTGRITAGTEELLKKWEFHGIQGNSSVQVAHVKGEGYGKNLLVRYRFEVEAWSDIGGFMARKRSHEVTFATRPLLPVQNVDPIPIYVQAESVDAFDVIFIPDTDVTDLAEFDSHCQGMILEAFLLEPTLKWFNKAFNFYINPVRATSHPTPAQLQSGQNPFKPLNWNRISFAEAHVIMHENDLNDWAGDTICTTEMQNRGTLRHEIGHVLFGLADEYVGGAHEEKALYPNNWCSKIRARLEASGRNRSASDVAFIETDSTSTKWYKICFGSCQMNLQGLIAVPYDEPCVHRILYKFSNL